MPSRRCVHVFFLTLYILVLSSLYLLSISFCCCFVLLQSLHVYFVLSVILCIACILYIHVFCFRILVFFPCPHGLTFKWWGCCGLCLWHKPTELDHSFLFSPCVFSVFIALSTVFHYINSPDNSLLSHSVLPVLFLPYLVLSAIHLFMKIFPSRDVILCCWLGLKPKITNFLILVTCNSRVGPY